MRRGNFEISYGNPLKGSLLERFWRFLARNGMEYEGGVDFTIVVEEDGEIVAAGSLGGNIIKYVTVSWLCQSRGLSAMIIGELVSHAARMGESLLFLFTHPRNEPLFAELGFFPVTRTAEALFMESRRGGIDAYTQSLIRSAAGDSGCVVAECDPMTRGHVHLIEEAAKRSGVVHVFVQSNPLDEIPLADRRAIVEEATAHLANVIVQPASPYLMPPSAYPDFLVDDHGDSENVNCRLELTLFAERIAGPLGVTRRFIGAEPDDPETRAYNRQMRTVLESRGIEVAEIPRLSVGGKPVSAGRVRRLYHEGRTAGARELLAPASLGYLDRLEEEDEFF